MPGSPVTMGAMVMVTPGASGPPDTGTIISIPLPAPLAAGMPVATAGAMAQMINSVWGFPYVVPIQEPASLVVKVGGRALLRTGDQIPAGPGILTILGPPAAPFVFDRS